MKFSNKKFEWKKRSNSEEQTDLEFQIRREKKKERREKYKVKNQKIHQLDYYDSNDEYGGMF